MDVVADLHLHSKYSRAVSQQMIVPKMTEWARLKGINLLGTGDFTHPIWFRELKEWLEENEGILKIKDKKLKIKGDEVGLEDTGVDFLLTVEISSIYSQGGRVRKIHNLILAPSFAAAEKISQELARRGANLLSDGRPIIGLSARDVLQLVLGVDSRCLVIPCHIWTPHFSLFGSESGFDAIEECFGDLSKYIFAAETGLSSDPEMNWQVSDLDNKNIVSFSDAHSGANLGREATVLEIPDNKILRYEDIRRALVGGGGGKWEVGREVGAGSKQTEDLLSPLTPDSLLTSPPYLSYTIEFYPEEGKYHWTGHRNCGVVQSPEETEKKGATCPVCGKGLTVGVAERVKKLSLGTVGATSVTSDKFGVRWIKKENRPVFVKLVPLMEIVAETKGMGKLTQKVLDEYLNLVRNLGPEIEILLGVELEKIAQFGGEKLAEGIGKVRSGNIFIKPGFDGEYGKVAVWGTEEREPGQESKQMGLF